LTAAGSGSAPKMIPAKGSPMSPRSVYLRDQAEKCRDHAASMTDDEIRQQLHVLAAEYIMRAVMIESDEPSHGNRE
jgi:hypothetical protein